jgi:hypothetical protein
MKWSEKENLSQEDDLDKKNLPWKAEPANFKIPTLDEIREARKKKIVISIASVYGDDMEDKLRAYCDDSADGSGERTFAFAGIVGTQEEWDEIKRAWLTCTEGKEFHGTNCESGYGDYKGIPLEKRLQEYKSLTTILADESKLYGFGVSVDIAAMKSNLPEAKEDAPYFKCFTHVVMGLAERGYLSKPRQMVQFTFDQNLQRRYNSILMLKLLSQWPNCEYGQYIDTDDVRFLSHKHVEIQAACLLAHDTMKHLDNLLLAEGLPTRKSLDRLLKTHRFLCHIYNNEYFEDISRLLKTYDEKNILWRNDYPEWLLQQKLDDNNSNRIGYLLSTIPPKQIIIE